MKLRNFLFVNLFLWGTACAMCQQIVNLPKPSAKRKALSVMQAFKQRHSTREFSNKPLSQQDLSDLLWAAQGQNREDGRLTAPTALNKQEIRVYVFCEKGVSLYNPHENTLISVVEGDHRTLVAMQQDFVKTAPVVLVYVADGDKFGATSDSAWRMMSVDTGIVSENVNLFCSAMGLVTVPRASMDGKAIQKLLGLNENQMPILNNPVGYPKKVK